MTVANSHGHGRPPNMVDVLFDIKCLLDNRLPPPDSGQHFRQELLAKLERIAVSLETIAAATGLQPATELVGSFAEIPRP